MPEVDIFPGRYGGNDKAGQHIHERHEGQQEEGRSGEGLEYEWARTRAGEIA